MPGTINVAVALVCVIVAIVFVKKYPGISLLNAFSAGINTAIATAHLAIPAAP